MNLFVAFFCLAVATIAPAGFWAYANIFASGVNLGIWIMILTYRRAHQ